MSVLVKPYFPVPMRLQKAGTKSTNKILSHQLITKKSLGKGAGFLESH